MNKSNKLLSDITFFRTYAKYLQHLGRRETIEETINRNMTMHLDKFPKLSRDIIKAYKQVHDLRVMPSMRSMQFGGEAILKNNIRLFNCSFVNINYPRVFAEILYLLLSGSGVGYSVQNRHIKDLPSIKKPREENIHYVHDSIEGWAEAIRILTESYFYGSIRPIFDFSKVRPRGSLLVTSGAKAPGPEPLKNAIALVEARLKTAIGRKLRSVELHDIICIIADCVLAGGIRRAALICLFDFDDNEMLTCKHGEWWNKHPYRARANNSAILHRSIVTYEQFCSVYDACIKSNAGEPGFFFTNDLDMGINPCAEIGLNSQQFCNLTTCNLTGISGERDLSNRVYSASLLGTLQASYTDFPYISENWKQVTEKESLLGVSLTGIADSSSMSPELLEKSAKFVLEINEKYAKKIDINIAARTTTIKPEGTASCILGSSSGIHDRHDDYYLRRIRMNKDDSLARYLTNIIPELVEDDLFSSTGVVVTIPQESPEGAIIKSHSSALSLLDRVLLYNKHWVSVGHRSGVNKHNVSCTINYKPEEVDALRERLWNEKEFYSGISLLPYDGGSYKQAPFESCDKETYSRLNSMVQDVDLSKVLELEDKTDLLQQLACSGGVCELV